MTETALRHFHGRDGVRLAYRELGQGRALVLIHGYTGHASMAWLQSGIAARVAAHGYRVIMPDLRGHGDSDRPHDPAAYPPDVLAEDGLALIAHLGLTDYDLGGYSLGGRTVVRMLARGAAPSRAFVGGQGLEAILHTAGRGGHYRHALTGSGSFQPGSPEQAIVDWVTASGGDPVALALVLDTFTDTPPEALADITVPVLVLTGVQDGHHATAAALAGALPAGQHVTLPGGHGGAVRTPEFEAAVTGFLGGQDPAGPARQ
jgi:pimeloyl-ACP methyl ester carboxylesterase